MLDVVSGICFVDDEEAIREDAELDAHSPFPLMVKFTKRVIDALRAERTSVAVQKRDAKDDRTFWEADYRLHMIASVQWYYEERLKYYRGLRDTQCKSEREVHSFKGYFNTWYYNMGME